MNSPSFVAERDSAKTYVFPVKVDREHDGRWSASCPALPGCATWGPTRAVALRNIQEAVEAYVEDLLEAGEQLPDEVRPLDAPAVAITL